MKKLLLIILVMLFLYPSNQTEATPQKISSTEQLRKAINDILIKTNTTGVAVAMIQSDGTVWQHTDGYSNILSKTPITENTQFRLGSISKMFVSLSIMTLVEQGEISLDDTVKNLVPEVNFSNPWENEHPIRVAHLLEHTTGWDAPHFVEQAVNMSTPVSTKQAIDFHPHSRISRWVPGSRTAYNQTGPLVAAYIIEKVTGKSFEQYVTEQFLDPLGMDDTSYFYTDNYKNNAAINYRQNRPQPYWHLSNRAAGALNSNLKDMIKYAKFMLQRGSNGQRTLISEHSLLTTEKPYSSFAAQAGMQLNWGLGNFTFHHNGYIYNGHEGSLFGSTALFAYQKDLGVAHIIMSNSESPASALIHKLLAEFETQFNPQQASILSQPIQPELHKLSGLYIAINPVKQDAFFATRLMPWKLSISEKGAYIKPILGGQRRELIAAENGLFKQNTTGEIVLVMTKDPIAGEVVHYGPQTFKKTTPLKAYTPLIVLVIWLLTAVTSILLALIWVPRLLLKKLNYGPQIQIRLWPLLNSLAMFITLVIFMKTNSSLFPFALVGHMTIPSVLLFLGTIFFAVSSFWSVFVMWKYKTNSLNRFVFWHSTLLAITSSLISIYLLVFGIVGIRLWT